LITGGVKTNYFSFYLSSLNAGLAPRYSQSITLTGNSTSVLTENNAQGVKIMLSFPKAGLGFGNSFFNFYSNSTVVVMPSGSVAQFYTGKVTVSLGVYA
jgi:hypothetical protein